MGREPGTSYSLYARDISHAWYTIFLPSGRNWFRKFTQWVYSSRSLDSLGCGSRFLIKFKIMIGAPYRANRSSKCRAAAVKNGSTTLTGEPAQVREEAAVGGYWLGVVRTLDGGSWGHVILLLHPVDRDTSAILQQQHKSRPEVPTKSGGKYYSLERSSCIEDLGVSAPHRSNISAEDSRTAS